MKPDESPIIELTLTNSEADILIRVLSEMTGFDSADGRRACEALGLSLADVYGLRDIMWVAEKAKKETMDERR